MKRLTLNYGARFEHFNASIPAESSPASTWIGARNFPEIPNVPNWNDWAVRLAAAYDLFGDGKTALKANAGKYVAAQAAGFAQTFNGMSGVDADAHLERRQRRQARSSNADGNDPDQRGDRRHLELRPDYVAARIRTCRAATTGNTARSCSASCCRALSVTAGYYRRDFYNLQVTDNQNRRRRTTGPPTASIHRPTRGCRCRGSRSRCTR